MVDEPDYVGYIEKTGERRISIHIPPDMIDALPVGVTELYSRTPSAPSAVGEWQPIETVPKDRTWVLCWGPDYFHGLAKFDPNPIWAEYPEYTHWQPLPSPPSKAQPDGE